MEDEVQQVVKRKSDYLTKGGNAGEGGGFVQAPRMKERAINLDMMELLHGGNSVKKEDRKMGKQASGASMDGVGAWM